VAIYHRRGNIIAGLLYFNMLCLICLGDTAVTAENSCGVLNNALCLAFYANFY